jgi:BlaI family penicillinase repressor
LGRKAIRLGAVQLQIMRILWQRGSATAREVTQSLAERRLVAHSTVQTLLRQLESKGAVRHKAAGRTFVYSPTVSEQEVTRRAARELMQRLFGGSPAGLVAHLIGHETLSREELERIRALIKRKEQEL